MGDAEVFGAPGRVTIGEGEDVALIAVAVAPWEDSGPRTVKLRLRGGAGVEVVAAEATVEVTPEPPAAPTLTLTATPAAVAEGRGGVIEAVVKLSRPAERDYGLTWEPEGDAKEFVRETERPASLRKGRDTATLRLTVLPRGPLPPPRTLRIRCTAVGAKAPAETRVTLDAGADGAGRDVLLLVLATEDLGEKWESLRGQLAAVVKGHGKRLVGGGPLLVRPGARLESVSLGAALPKGEQFGNEQKVNPAHNAALAAREEALKRTKSRGNKSAVETYIVWASSDSADVRGTGTAEQEAKEVPEGQALYFVWALATAGFDATLEKLHGARRQGRYGLLYVRKDRGKLDEELDGYLRPSGGSK